MPSSKYEPKSGSPDSPPEGPIAYPGTGGAPAPEDAQPVVGGRVERESFWVRMRRQRAERELRRAEEAALARQERDRIDADRRRVAEEEALRKRQAREQRRLERERQLAEERESRLMTQRKAEDPAPPARPPGGTLDERAIREAAERQALARLAQSEQDRVHAGRPEPVEQAEPVQPLQPVVEVARTATDRDPGAPRAETTFAEAEAEAEADRLIARARGERPPPPVEDPEPPVSEPEPPPAQAPPASEPPAIDEPSPPPPVESPEVAEALLAELARTADKLDARRGGEQRLAAELAQAEQLVAETQRRTAEAIERAAAQLEQVEARAREAEERAERAERLARMQDAGAEQADRLQQILDRIAAAEERATTAALRAREAFGRVGEAEPGQEPGADAVGAAPVADSPGSINAASFEDLRRLGLSALEARSLLEHRERVSGFTSLDELDKVAGLSAQRAAELRLRTRL